MIGTFQTCIQNLDILKKLIFFIKKHKQTDIRQFNHLQCSLKIFCLFTPPELILIIHVHISSFMYIHYAIIWVPPFHFPKVVKSCVNYYIRLLIWNSRRTEIRICLLKQIESNWSRGFWKGNCCICVLLR